MLMVTYTEQIVKSVETIIKSFINNTGSIENGIGVLILIGGMILTLLNGVITFLAIISAYNVEIAFMTKREQWKHRITNIAVILLSIWGLYITCGVVGLFSNVADERIFNGAIVVFVLALYGLVSLLFLMSLHDKLKKLHLYRMICLILKNVLIKLQSITKICINFFRCVLIEILNVISRVKFIKKIFTVLRKAQKLIQELWKSSALSEDASNCIKYSKEEIIKIITCLDIVLLGLTLNSYWAIFVRAEYNLLLMSTLMTILTFEILLLLSNFLESGNAKIYYIDSELEKKIYVFLQYNEKYCLGGNRSNMGECDEYYLVSYETIQKETLYPISRQSHKSYYKNYKKVVIQANNIELIIDDILKKVNNVLEEKKIPEEGLEKTNIYIKPMDKKVYYVMSEQVSGEIEI